MSRLAFVDTETTGLDPDKHPIWEVALIVREDGADPADDLELSWQLPLTPAAAAQHDPVARELTRFDARRWPDQDLTAPRAFAEAFADATAGAHIVGAVPSFDEERLRRMFRPLMIATRWHYHLIDVEALAVGYLAAAGNAPDLPWSSTDLSEAMGVAAHPDAHEAMADARWARDLYDAVVTYGGYRQRYLLGVPDPDDAGGDKEPAKPKPGPKKAQ